MASNEDLALHDANADNNAPGILAPAQNPIVPKCLNCKVGKNSFAALRAHNKDRHNKLTFLCGKCSNVFATEAEKTLHKIGKEHPRLHD